MLHNNLHSAATLAAQIVMKNGVRFSPLGYNLAQGEDILQSTVR